MSAIQVAIPTPLLIAAVGVAVALVTTVTIVRSLDLLSRVARYRSYRRSYPAAERGRVWRHVR